MCRLDQWVVLLVLENLESEVVVSSAVVRLLSVNVGCKLEVSDLVEVSLNLLMGGRL